MDPFGIDPDRPQFSLSLSLSDAMALTDALRVLAYVREGDADAIATYVVTTEVCGPPVEECDRLADRIDGLTADVRAELVRRIREAADARRAEYESDD